MGFPLDETFYRNPNRTSPKEDTMTIPTTTTDLINSVHGDGTTLADEIANQINIALELRLERNRFNIADLTEELTGAAIDHLADLDLTAFTYDQEA